jgi:hypothetical protein
MGFLTTVTIYNDAMEYSDGFKKELADQIMEGHHLANRYGKAKDMSIGCHCGAVNVQPSRHADHHVLYLHYGNMVHVVGASENDWKELCQRSPECAKKMIQESKRLIKYAEKQLNDSLEKD